MKTIKNVPNLQNIAFFSELPADKRHFLEAKLQRFEFLPGKCIIRQGGSGQFLGIIERGQVLLESTHSPYRTLTTGQYFGAEMLRDGKPSEYTITTQTDTVLRVLDRSDWLTVRASMRTRKTSDKKTPWKKWALVWLVMIISLAMIVVILGPTLLEAANNRLPRLMAEAGRADLAEEYVRYVIRWQPVAPKLYADLGEILVLQGKEAEAIRAYQEAISLDEYLPWIQNNLGVLLLAQGAADQAADHLQKAINLDPEIAETHHNLGNVYYSLGRWEAAANAYQRSLALDPNQPNVKAAWAGILLNEGQLAEARKAWEEVLAEEPGNLLAQKGLGIIAVIEQDPALALTYLEAVRSADPEDMTTRLYLGLALVALDRPAEAANEFKYIVEMGTDPELLKLAGTHLQVIQE